MKYFLLWLICAKHVNVRERESSLPHLALTDLAYIPPEKQTTIQTQMSPSPVAVETIIEMDTDKSDQVTWRILHEDLAPSKYKQTMQPCLLLALNLENRTAAIPFSLSQSSVPTVKTPSSSPAPIPAMTFKATVPEPQIPPALSTMTAKASLRFCQLCQPRLPMGQRLSLRHSQRYRGFRLCPCRRSLMLSWT